MSLGEEFRGKPLLKSPKKTHGAPGEKERECKGEAQEGQRSRD